MYLYILIGIFLLFLSFRKFNRIVFWSSIFALIVLAGCRGINIGTDTHSYSNIFDWIKDGVILPIEPLWYLLNLLVIKIGLGYNSLLLLASALTLIPVGIVCLRNSNNPQLSLFFYYALYAYLNSFNLMRQFVSISFILLAYSYIHTKRKFWLFSIIAVLFHTSAVLGFLALGLSRLKLTKVKVITALAVTFAGGMVINDGLFQLLAGPYAHYLVSGTFDYRGNMLSIYAMSIIMNLWFMYIYNTSQQSIHQNFWLKLFFVGILIMNLSMQLALGARIILYFTLAQIILYPIYRSHNRIKNKNLALGIVLVYVSVIFIKILILGNQVEFAIYPYQAFWESV